MTMTKDKLYEALSPLQDNDRNKILDEVCILNQYGLTFRRAVNTYFNQRLVLLDVPLHIRLNLIHDGSDAEWCGRFNTYILPRISKLVMRV